MAHDIATAAVAQRLKLFRKALGLRAVDMRRPLGISSSAWSNWENGTRRISLNEALSLTTAYPITLDWIYRASKRGLDEGVAARIAELERECKRRADRDDNKVAS